LHTCPPFIPSLGLVHHSPCVCGNPLLLPWKNTLSQNLVHGFSFFLCVEEEFTSALSSFLQWLPGSSQMMSSHLFSVSSRNTLHLFNQVSAKSFFPSDEYFSLFLSRSLFEQWSLFEMNDPRNVVSVLFIGESFGTVWRFYLCPFLLYMAFLFPELKGLLPISPTKPPLSPSSTSFSFLMSLPI